MRGKGKKIQAPDQAQDQAPAERRASMTWAKRLKRVFNIDIETCSECIGDFKIIASDVDTIQKQCVPVVLIYPCNIGLKVHNCKDD